MNCLCWINDPTTKNLKSSKIYDYCVEPQSIRNQFSDPSASPQVQDRVVQNTHSLLSKESKIHPFKFTIQAQEMCSKGGNPDIALPPHCSVVKYIFHNNFTFGIQNKENVVLLNSDQPQQIRKVTLSYNSYFYMCIHLKFHF